MSEQDLETLKILNEQYEKDVKKANIPVPPIITIDDYDKHVPRDFVKPQSYLRWKGESPLAGLGSGFSAWPPRRLQRLPDAVM